MLLCDREVSRGQGIDRKGAKRVEVSKDRVAAERLHNTLQVPAYLTARTLYKALESLVAGRIASLVEDYTLLLKTHFSARKQQVTTYALSYLCKRVFKA